MQARIVLALVFAGLLVTGALLTYALLSKEEEQTFLRWQDPTITVRGKVLYRVHCSGCHGMPDGPASARVGSQAAPHDETGHTWEHPDYALFQLIRDGIAVANCLPVDPEQMPRFKGVLTDADLVAVLSYIKSTWPDETRRHHDMVNKMYGPYNRAVGELIDAAGRQGG